MPKIEIDGIEVECRDGITVLQAALEAGWSVPHYCYHPGLSVVASCRLCLMEMQMPSPKGGGMEWSSKLVPSCQVPVKNGLVVRFASDQVKRNQRRVMEFLLLNHPLDCPVCDQAGECLLQDYSYEFGDPTSRMRDEKHKSPKKDIGPRTLLYSDRCVLCTRCVRFTREITGTHDLCVTHRGSENEIDVFPGKALDNPLQGNVVDLCPVGALLDKDFLFKQRVWFLKRTKSICPGCSTGCAVSVDSNEGVVYRLKPRYNPGVNDWWMCDEGRFGWKYMHDANRITAPVIRRGGVTGTPPWDSVPEIVDARLRAVIEAHGPDKVAVVLSPMMACEEAWLLVRFLRSVASEATLVLGPVPIQGQLQMFPVGSTGDAVRFTIRREKCPNRRGVETIIAETGGPTLSFEVFCEQATAGAFAAAWIVGGYPEPWVTKDFAKAVGQLEFVVAQDLFPNEVTEVATLVLPACGFAQREGSFMNFGGRIQPFDRAIAPPDGAKGDGQYLYELAGFTGLYSGRAVREMMAQEIHLFSMVKEAPPMPVHQH
ncbi:MAG: (2Fe-2S)-binding protein [Phycisphaerales bacterium]|nr:MAG: (2Fe-2S)-binding protein [Phycisphaerales bacterium]